MTTNPDAWVYGDFAPDPASRDLVGLKASRLLKQLPPVDDLSVLDYGAGEGKHLHLVRKLKPRAHLVGVDIRPPNTAVDFEFHQVSADGRLPFADNAFDVVISCDVLEHVRSIEHSLDEICRVLRSGGSFIGFVPAEGGVGPYAFFRLIDSNIYRDTKDHGHAYTRRELIQSFAVRFEIRQVTYSYHFLGSTLDATFFASFKLPRFGRRVEKFWRGEENDIYRSRAVDARPSLMSRIVRLANRMAYQESQFLKCVPFGAKGLHFHLVKRIDYEKESR